MLTLCSMQEMTPDENKNTAYRRFYYVTPDVAQWPRYSPDDDEYYLLPPESVDANSFASWSTMLECTDEEANSLACIAIFCDVEKVRGGKASTMNMKKKSVVRAEWVRTCTLSRLSSQRSKAAYRWLMKNNSTYLRYQEQHAQVLEEATTNPNHVWFIPTSFLLLHLEGVEVAARPLLYARASFGDSDIKGRLSRLGHLEANQLPSMRSSFMKKYLSRCFDYSRDFLLLCLLYDIALARSLMQIVSIAEKKDMSADAAADHLHNFDSYWRHQQAILEDRCRQLDRLPTLFITIAPAEWKFPLHEPTLAGYREEGKLSDAQGLLSLHFYEVLITIQYA